MNSRCTALTALDCEGNGMSSLSVSDSTALMFLIADNNPLNTASLNAIKTGAFTLVELTYTEKGNGYQVYTEPVSGKTLTVKSVGGGFAMGYTQDDGLNYGRYNGIYRCGE